MVGEGGTMVLRMRSEDRAWWRLEHLVGVYVSRLEGVVKSWCAVMVCSGTLVILVKV